MAYAHEGCDRCDQDDCRECDLCDSFRCDDPEWRVFRLSCKPGQRKTKVALKLGDIRCVAPNGTGCVLTYKGNPRDYRYLVTDSFERITDILGIECEENRCPEGRDHHKRPKHCK